MLVLQEQKPVVLENVFQTFSTEYILVFVRKVFAVKQSLRILLTPLAYVHVGKWA